MVKIRVILQNLYFDSLMDGGSREQKIQKGRLPV